jgi:NitT/TauT family transport system permease protein
VAAVIVIAVWQLVAVHNRYILPRPWAVALQLVHHPGSYLHGARVTLTEALAGLAIGFGAGVLLGIVMSEIRIVERALLPLAIVANVTPVVALAPGLVVAFGFGITPKLIVTAVICFFPALMNTIAGLRSTDPELLDVLQTLHASRLEVLIRVRLPCSLPYLFSAARICLPLSVVGAVVAELVTQGSTSGLGTVISQAAANAQLDRVYASIVCLALLGVGLTAFIVLAERRLLAWHPSQSRDRQRS